MNSERNVSGTNSTTAETENTTVTAAKTDTSAAPIITDKRASRRAILDEPTDYSKNRNRLPNVRWPLGEEPDVEGNNKEDGWVNLKLEVTEHPDPGPNQRNLLGGGPELRLTCRYCRQPLHIAASRRADSVLTEGGFKLKGDERNLTGTIVACVCPAGHITQLRGDFVRRLLKND